MDKPDKLSYTVDGAEAATGLARSRLYAAFADGSLASFKSGRRRMISRRALEAFIEKLEGESAPKAPRKVRA